MASKANYTSRETYVGQKAIMARLGMSERTVRRGLQALVELGAITIIRRWDANERVTTNHYSLPLTQPANDDRSPNRPDVTERPTGHTNRSDQPVTRAGLSRATTSRANDLEPSSKEQQQPATVGRTIKARPLGKEGVQEMGKKKALKKSPSRLVPGTSVELKELIRQFPKAGTEELLRHVVPSDHALAEKNLQKMGVTR